MKINSFEDLPVWKDSIILVREVYDLTSRGNFVKDFSLKDQIRRAVVSISSNIVEGFEKSNNNEFIRFLKIAKGSAGEVRNLLYVALSVGYIKKEDFEKLNEKFASLAKQIGSFITYLEDQRRKGNFIKK